MKCDRFEMLVQRYHDGELTPGEKAEYENHMRTCGSCRAMDSQFVEVFGALGSIELMEPSEGFDSRVLAGVDISRYKVNHARKAVLSVGRIWRDLPAPLRAGGILAAIFGLFVTIYSPILSLIVLGAGRVAEIGGSVLVFIQKVIEDPQMLPVYLSSLDKYRVAAKVLVKTIQRGVPGFTVGFFSLAVIAASIIIFMVFRMARIAWKKGETHVGIY